MKVVLLCRVSTNSQDYQRQVDELTSFCKDRNWHIEKIFANKISGAKKLEERTEVVDMIDYIHSHKIDKVCVLEISRMARNTLEALRIIELLNQNNISLFIKNYGIETLTDGKVNPVASLITTILLEISSMERALITERVTSGRDRYIAKCKMEGIKMGRPITYRKADATMKEQYTKEIQLLKKKISLRNINKITGTSIGTLRKLYKYV